MAIQAIYTHLIDERNTKIWEDLNKKFNIVLSKSYEPNYITNFKPELITIFIDEENINPAAFTHELLHILLKSKYIMIAEDYNSLILEHNQLFLLFSKNLRDHIGNCLEHIKMLPIYLNLGFDKTMFNSDYAIKKMNEEFLSLLKSKYKVNEVYNRLAVDAFIGKFFSMVACNNKSHNYLSYYEDLRGLDNELYTLLNNFWNSWENYDIEAPNTSYSEMLEIHMKDLKKWIEKKAFL